MNDIAPLKSLFYIFLSLGMGLLAMDFIFVYIPLSGWVLQAVLVGVYLEYLKPKKTILLIAVMEIFFLLSYGGSVVVAAILTLFGVELFLPIIAGCYLGLIASIFIFGYAANRMFHKIRLFERLSERKADESNFPKIN
jgi:hypothetical protein